MQLDHGGDHPVAHLLVDVKNRRVRSVVGCPHPLVTKLDRLCHRLVLQCARNTATAHFSRGCGERGPRKPALWRGLEVRESDYGLAIARDPEPILENPRIVEGIPHPFVERLPEYLNRSREGLLFRDN